MLQLVSLFLLPVPLWGFFFPSAYTPFGPALSLLPLKQRFVLGYCLTCFAKVFIFCNADTKLLSLMFPQAVCWLRQCVGRFLGEVCSPFLTAPEIWRESRGVQKTGPGGVRRGEKQTSSALATGTAAACCFVRLDVKSSGYLLLKKRKPKRTWFFCSQAEKFHSDLEEIESFASSGDFELGGEPLISWGLAVKASCSQQSTPCRSL